MGGRGDGRGSPAPRLDGRLDACRAEWDARPALGVVVAADGYPGRVRGGDVIHGLEQEAGADAKVFHAGTRLDAHGQMVTAVIQPRGDAQPSTDEIRQFLRPMLSGYKLPRAVTCVAEIPRSATGKANYPRAKELAVAATSGAGV